MRRLNENIHGTQFVTYGDCEHDEAHELNRFAAPGVDEQESDPVAGNETGDGEDNLTIVFVSTRLNSEPRVFTFPTEELYIVCQRMKAAVWVAAFVGLPNPIAKATSKPRQRSSRSLGVNESSPVRMIDEFKP